MRFLKTKLIVILMLMLCVGVFCIPASASDSGEELLTVNEAYVDGKMLRISVTDVNGVDSALALRLTDYVKDVENREYISIQAVDLLGNKSGVIEIKNPYYNPSSAAIILTPAPTETETTQTSQSAVPDGSKPFTPDGSGTVIDNVTDGDGKEFFSIGTEDGSVFYLIVDRQRNSDNVYLLNAVTLDDLAALAEKDGKTINSNNSTSAIQKSEQQSTTENIQHSTQPESTTETAEKTSEKNDTGMYILIGIAVIAVGGLGYYFKIVRGKKNNSDVNDDEDNNNDEYGYDDDSDEDSEDYGDSETENGGDDE